MEMKLGVWVVCEDRQGEFHHKGTTGQTFDIPRQSDSSTWTQKSP